MARVSSIAKNAALLIAAVSSIAALQQPVAQAAGYPIGGKILEEYNSRQYNGQSGQQFFGDATSNELLAKNNGRWQAFQKNSSIYWNANVSNGHANQIGGLIRDKWGTLNYENGPLGYPTTREMIARAPGGQYNKFQGGNVYWSQSTAAHPVWGLILEAWGGSDYEHGPYGLPNSDEYNCSTGSLDDTDQTYGAWGQNFQGGWLTANVNRPFFNKDDSAVDNKVLFYRIQGDLAGKYYSEIAHANTVWNNLGSVEVVDGYDQPERDAPLVIKGVDRPDVDYAGLYSLTQPAKTIELNDAFLDGYGSTQKDAVAAHEFGHALGLLHNCQYQLMDPGPSSSSSESQPQFIDIQAYRNMWG